MDDPRFPGLVATTANSCQHKHKRTWRWDLPTNDKRWMDYPAGYGPAGKIVEDQDDAPQPLSDEARLDAARKRSEEQRLITEAQLREDARMETNDLSSTAEKKRKDREELAALDREDMDFQAAQKARTAKDQEKAAPGPVSAAQQIADLTGQVTRLQEEAGKEGEVGGDSGAVKMARMAKTETVMLDVDEECVSGVSRTDCTTYRGFDGITLYVIKKGLAALINQAPEQRSVRRAVSEARSNLFFTGPTQLLRKGHFHTLLCEAMRSTTIDSFDSTFNNRMHTLRQHPPAASSHVIVDPERFNNFLTASPQSRLDDFMPPGQKMNSFDTIITALTTWSVIEMVTHSYERGEIIGRLSRDWAARQSALPVPPLKIAWKLKKVYIAIMRGLREEQTDLKWYEQGAVTDWVGGALGDPFFVRGAHPRLPLENLTKDWEYLWDAAFAADTPATRSGAHYGDSALSPVQAPSSATFLASTLAANLYAAPTPRVPPAPKVPPVPKAPNAPVSPTGCFQHLLGPDFLKVNPKGCVRKNCHFSHDCPKCKDDMRVMIPLNHPHLQAAKTQTALQAKFKSLPG